MKLLSELSLRLQKTAAIKYAVGTAAALFVFSFPFVNKFSILTLWLLVLSAIATFFAYKKFNFKAIYLFPVIFFAFRMFSLAFAPPDVTFKNIECCLSLLLMPAIFSLFRLSQAQTLWFVRGVFYALLVAVVACWLVFLRYIIFSEQTFLEIFKHPKAYAALFLGRLIFWQPSFVSISISFIIPLSFYLRSKLYIKPLIMWAAAILSIAFILATGSRIGIVVSTFMLTLGLIYYHRYITWVAKIGVLLSILALGLFAHFLPYSITSDPVRANLRSLGANVIAEKPVCGSGVYSMHRYINSEETAQKYNAHYGYTFNHFHHTFIDETVQFGLVGGGLLAAFFACLIVLAFRKKDFLLLAFLAIYLPFAFVESIFMSVKGIMPFMFWFCFLVSTQEERRTLAKI
ncbi:MAG: O-antigen ligase family protein [Prevotellaceae bacterium]|jgi:hypothetical protein|nr:O-antigen ligase family protein [Prevotellaceae bacterium]